jgi:hypothetical protein
MIKKLRNEPYAPKWEEEEKKEIFSGRKYTHFRKPSFLVAPTVVELIRKM